MNYCLNYFMASVGAKSCEEIKIKYLTENEINYLQQFINLHKDRQKIVIDVRNLTREELEERIPQFKELELENSVFEISDLSINIWDKTIPFFTDAHINSWEKLEDAVKCGVSEVYITDEFGFSIDKISKYCKENNIKIRVYPNIAQSNKENQEINQLKKFFIRPEDVIFFKDYVDTLEFLCPIEFQDFYYKAYKNKNWNSFLNLLIVGLDSMENCKNPNILPVFGFLRTSCGGQCENCTSCDSIEKIAEVAYNNGKVFKIADGSREHLTNLLKQRAEVDEELKEILEKDGVSEILHIEK